MRRFLVSNYLTLLFGKSLMRKQEGTDLFLKSGVHGGRGRSRSGGNTSLLRGGSGALSGSSTSSTRSRYSGACSRTLSSSIISCCSIRCALGSALEDAHESGHIGITSKANFTITCRCKSSSANQIRNLFCTTILLPTTKAGE